jgi:asparagine synthase (glutamine-hydrolysing)
MCGIAGYYSSRVQPDEEILQSLFHRGLDSRGFVHAEINNRHLGLGHTRLSILDLSDHGRQPMTSAAGHVVLTFNGEVYNFGRLRLQHLKEIAFRSETDTEVVLQLYLKYGISFLEILEGDFAFCIYDSRLHKLFLVRDRAGVKPLYYCHHRENFFFASELKSLFLMGVPRKVKESALQKYFVFKYSPGDETLVDGVYRVKPGTYLEYDLNTWACTTSTYWQLKKNELYQKMSFNEAKEEVLRLMQQSVSDRLIADVPLASLLSGGLDSSIIAYHLQSHPEIRHYCAVKSEADIRKEGTTADATFARQLAAQWKLTLEEISIGSDEANFDLISQTLYYGDDLVADGSQIPAYLICKKASEKAKVILSGMGADELFLGYAGHQISWLALMIDHLPALAREPLYRQLASLNQGKGKFLAYRRYLRKLGTYAGAGNLKFGFFNIVGDYETSLSLLRGDERETLGVFEKYFNETGDVFDSIFRFEYDNFLQKNLNYLDRMAMASSVEGRVPFLDHHLIEFAYSLPRHYKLSKTGRSKHILKEAYARVLPSQIINRRKAGFGMPLRSIFSNHEKINRLVDFDFFESFSGFSMEAMHAMINRHLAGTDDNSSLIYALISLRHWYRMHIAEDKTHAR